MSAKPVDALLAEVMREGHGSLEAGLVRGVATTKDYLRDAVRNRQPIDLVAFGAYARDRGVVIPEPEARELAPSEPALWRAALPARAPAVDANRTQTIDRSELAGDAH